MDALKRFLLGLFSMASVLFLAVPTVVLVRWVRKNFLREEHKIDASYHENSGNESDKGVVRSPDVHQSSVTFRYLAPEARRVSIVGDFDRSKSHLYELLSDSSGLWEISLELDTGLYHYRYKVDLKWDLDPSNPNKASDPHPQSIVEIK